jgi:hypothetical protein
MIPKLNKASYVSRSLKQVLFSESLKMVYFSIFHSVMSYGIMFWAVSTYSKIIFTIQKRVIRIITNSSNKDSCQDLFKKLNILPLQSQYLLTLLMFVVKNKELFKMTSGVHNFNTRSSHDLYLPTANLTVFQKGVWYSGIEVCNHLPANIKQLSSNKSKFKMTLKRFGLTNYFYTLGEYYNWKKNLVS